ncbi:Hsp70 family protein [Aggregicoccus sp. 17bor-14]|uniref:Hsp70 family protein n=1 Tax=Myxococcaceae TaxID=31 RepID=UPI00129C4DA9|nr:MULTISPECIES: Hsp70 family protein [Myxococcaceae]MBF5045906.1 Hsp70 family protein [Simulacricoccus sp. 17bor-14]MRI91640.1 Hsp70 family protein [Aggregicoccus sp. 17bor-14]
MREHREPVVGIDLGTTHSVIATVSAEDGRPRLIPTRTGARLTPSVVGITRAGERLVGERAQLLAETQPDNVAWATKRFIGRRYTPELAAAAKSVVPYALHPGPAGDVRVKLGGRVLPLTQVSAAVLGELKLDAEAYFGRPVRRCVVTVPAHFDDSQRQATREAASIAGLEVLRLVNEPTAAALAYGLSRGFSGRALVFDLGGGTFDVSVLDVREGVFEVKATGGDAQLGGEDFDQRIVQWLLAQVDPQQRDAVARDPLSLSRLKVTAERAKRALTDAEEVAIDLEGLAGGCSVHTALTRAFFEALSEPLSRRCLEVCERVLREAKLGPEELDAVLLVGGMTRVPLVRRLVTATFGRPPAEGVHPDEAVALGAAVHAAELEAKRGDTLLLDVAGHSLGVGMMGGIVRHLIARNTPVPVAVREVFHPAAHHQTEVRIPVYQGESTRADENTQLGEVVLRELQAAERGQTPVEVSFELSTEGTLSVRVTDLNTGIAKAVQLEARAATGAPELERLTREQAAWAGAEADARSEEAFRRVLERGERLAKVLETSARENPGPASDAAVARVRTLLAEGHALAGQTGPEAKEPRMRVSRELLSLLHGV